MIPGDSELRALASCALGVEGAAQRVTEQVDRPDGDHDGQAWKDAGPWRADQHFLGIEDHASPRWSWALNAEAEKRKPGLQQNYVTYAEGGRNQQGPERVGEQVPEDNAPAASP